MSAMSFVSKTFRIRLAAISLTLLPSLASADFCDLLAGSSAPNCRSNAASMDATIIGNWLRIKPEMASQPNTGKKGKFSSATTVSYGLLGVKSPNRLKLSIDCFGGERSMRLQAITHMLGLTAGQNTAFKLTFKADSKPSFTEDWVLNWRRSELEAPSGSRLANELLGAQELTITTEKIIDNKYPAGYVYKVDGFDKVNSGLCQ